MPPQPVKRRSDRRGCRENRGWAPARASGCGFACGEFCGFAAFLACAPAQSSKTRSRCRCASRARPARQHRSQSPDRCPGQAGAGVGCGHRFSSSDGERVPFPRVIPRGRLCRRGRAFRGGAVCAPDCAREAEGTPLPSASHGFSKIGAARQCGTRGGGSGVRFPGDHHSTIRQMSSPKTEIFRETRTNFRRRPASGPLLTAPGRAPCPPPPPCRRSGLRRWAARRWWGRDIA